jgi:hypothetical protein
MTAAARTATMAVANVSNSTLKLAETYYIMLQGNLVIVTGVGKW